MWARVHFVWVSRPCTVPYGRKIYLLDCKMHDTMLSVSCFEAFYCIFCLFFNLQSVLFSLHHLFGFIGSTASLIFCKCIAFVFHMKFAFIWNLAIFMFYLKNFHMKRFFWFLDLFQFKWKWSLFCLIQKLYFHMFQTKPCRVISYKIIFDKLERCFGKQQ